MSVTSLATLVHQRLAAAFAAAMPEAGAADPMLRGSDRADFQANGVLALAKALERNPRELATRVADRSRRATSSGRSKSWGRAFSTSPS
jgi:arginyl-tRNA synthetase